MSSLPKPVPAARSHLLGQALGFDKCISTDSGMSSGKFDVLEKSSCEPAEALFPQPSSVVVGFRTSENSSSQQQTVGSSESRIPAAMSRGLRTTVNRPARTGLMRGTESRPFMEGTVGPSGEPFADENSKRLCQGSKAERKPSLEDMSWVTGKRNPLSPLQRMLTDWQSIPVIDLDSPGSDDLRLDTDSTSQEEDEPERCATVLRLHAIFASVFSSCSRAFDW